MLKRVGTSRTKTAAATVQIGDTRLEISQLDLATFTTAEEIKVKLDQLASLSGIKVPTLFVHINRDMGLAMAVGALPDVWPENEKRPVFMSSSLHFGGYTVAPGNLGLAAKLGLNMVAQVPGSVKEYQQYIAAATEYGLKVRCSLSPSLLTATEDKVISYLSALSGIVSMWYLPEEPKTAEQHEAWLRLYNIIKGVDAHPVGLYLAASATPEYFKAWADVTDVIFCGSYPELYGIERVSIVTRIKGAVASGARVIATPQFYDAQTALDISGGVLPDGYYVGHPTLQHMRFDAFISLMLGAQGIDWYTTKYGFLEPDLIESLRVVLFQVNDMTLVLASTNVRPIVSYKLLSGPAKSAAGYGVQHDSVYITTRSYLGNDYLFVASLVVDPMEVQLIGVNGVSVKVLHENRSLDVVKGAVTDKFIDYDIHIYKVVA